MSKETFTLTTSGLYRPGEVLRVDGVLARVVTIRADDFDCRPLGPVEVVVHVMRSRVVSWSRRVRRAAYRLLP